MFVALVVGSDAALDTHDEAAEGLLVLDAGARDSRSSAAMTSGWSSWPGTPREVLRSECPIQMPSTPSVAAIASTFSTPLPGPRRSGTRQPGRLAARELGQPALRARSGRGRRRAPPRDGRAADTSRAPRCAQPPHPSPPSAAESLQRPCRAHGRYGDSGGTVGARWSAAPPPPCSAGPASPCRSRSRSAPCRGRRTGRRRP